MKKKTLSIALSVLMLVSMLIPFSAFAGIKNDEMKKQVQDDIAGEVAYLNFTPSLEKAVSSQMLFRVDQSKKHGFLTELSVNLVQNDGKIIVNGAENALYYAVAINILDILGEDYTNYRGYNLKEIFENCTQTNIENPYYVMQAVEAARTIGNDALAKRYIDKLIEDTYTMGSGMKYYGYSTDNNGMFLATVGYYKDDYQAYVDDAKALLESKKTANGYDSGYGVSASTTTCALLAYTILGEEDKAVEAYKLLVDNFESPNNNGVMQYEGEDNAYATSQAVRSLSYFVEMFDDEQTEPTPGEPSVGTDDNEPTDAQPKKDTDKAQAKSDASVKSPQTGASVAGFAVIGFGAALLACTKKKEN